MKPIVSLIFLWLVASSIATSQTNFWQQTSTIGGGAINRLAVNQNGVVFAATNDSGVFRSTNDGVLWTKTSRLFANQALQRILGIYVNSSGTVFASRDGSALADAGVYWTSDDGDTWLLSSNSYGFWNSFTRDTTGNLFAGGNTIIKSTDGGLSWFQANVGILGSITSLCSNSSNYLFAGGNGEGVYRSVNDGTIWSQTVLSTVDVRGLATASGGLVYAATFGKGVWKSTDNGTGWDITGTGFTATPQFMSIVISLTGELFAASYDSGIVRSTNGGATEH